MPTPEADRVADRLSADTDVTPEEVRAVAFALRESISPAERLEHGLHPWTSYVVIPLFALANAGIAVDEAVIRRALSSAVTAGVVAGLVIGKFIGIAGFTWLAVRLRLGRLPAGVDGRHIAGMAALGGIGFTVSIFVTGLAFDDPTLQEEAKIGVLAASVLAAAIGAAVLAGNRRRRPSDRHRTDDQDSKTPTSRTGRG